MGSLTSRPKVPSIAPQAIVATPSETSISPNVPPVSVPQIAQSETENVSEGAEERIVISSDIARVENLLRRNRGVGGTILTGFRGLLSANELAPQRKTLLGE